MLFQVLLRNIGQTSNCDVAINMETKTKVPVPESSAFIEYLTGTLSLIFSLNKAVDPNIPTFPDAHTGFCVRLSVGVCYLCDGHLCVLLLLLQLLLKKLQVVLRCQRSERRRTRAARCDALRCHSENGLSIEVLFADKKRTKTRHFNDGK